ncbi:MAG: CoA pyrophosphatase [Gammaproteobacteria bacterium]
MTPLERTLRAALAGTSEAAPRPLASIELPMNLDKLIPPLVFKSLRPASVLVPVMKRRDGLRVLLTRRSESLRSHKGQVSFPGGGREEHDETAAAAAKREAFEEAGIPPAAVEVIGYLDDYPTVTRYLVTPVVGMVEDVAEVKPCAREVAEIFEVPLEFVIAPANFERKVFSRDGVNLPFFELNYGEHRIWGATAGMLWNLSQKVVANETKEA